MRENLGLGASDRDIEMYWRGPKYERLCDECGRYFGTDDETEILCEKCRKEEDDVAETDVAPE